MRSIRAAQLVATIVTLLTMPALAGPQRIDFEELPASNDSLALVGDEYRALGARFTASDDGATWDGVSRGDPGGWQIEGTAGSSFLGFDGESYVMTLDFDAPVEDFQLDVARAIGAAEFVFDFFELTGFLDGEVVESSAVFFRSPNRWQTVALTGPVDRVIWFGTGLRNHRYGVDNLRWVELAPPVLPVDVDVRPGSDENKIKLDSRGVVPVVLYGEPGFAVEEVVGESLVFGPAEAPLAHRKCPHFEYVDDDDRLDLVTHHRSDATGIQAGDGEACLRGETLDGRLFEGCDLVTPKPKKAKKR